MAEAHILVLPFPAHGHITPLMELSHRLVDHGFEVTFVNTEGNHARIIGTLQEAGGTAVLAGIHMASISDGVEDDEDRKDIGKVLDSYSRHMQGNLEQLIAEMEATGRPKVKWLVCDVSAWWSLDVAKKLGIRVAAVCPVSVACLAFNHKIPKLIDDGLLDSEGWPARDETFQLAPGIPPLHTSHLPWNNIGTCKVQPVVSERFSRLSTLADMVLCNSFQEAEAGAFKLVPNVLPIGPLTSDGELRKPVGQFLQEDTRCLSWLDAQPDRSVVYVAFGSIAVFDPCQFQELALGLELTGRPFLWVVRPDIITGGDLSKAWFNEFQIRIAGTGMVVSWCPQQKVLAHRAVASFVSHCGWNSTMEGLRNGLPFLCWPYFSDQFLHRNYITDVWRTGLAVSSNAGGVVTKKELWSKLEQVIGDDEMRERAQLFKDAARRAIGDGGSSYENFQKFVNLMRE